MKEINKNTYNGAFRRNEVNIHNLDLSDEAIQLLETTDDYNIYEYCDKYYLNSYGTYYEFETLEEVKEEIESELESYQDSIISSTLDQIIRSVEDKVKKFGIMGSETTSITIDLSDLIKTDLIEKLTNELEKIKEYTFWEIEENELTITYCEEA